MSNCKYESGVKMINATPDVVYKYLSDLRNLEKFRALATDPSMADKMKDLPKDVKPEQIEQFRQYLEKMEFGEDFLAVDSPIGNVKLQIIEREEPKLLKLEGQGAPVPLNLWIQLLPASESCKMKVTVGAEVSIFMKAMVSKPLQKAADGVAEILSKIPYNAM